MKTAELKKALTALKQTYRRNTLPILGAVEIYNDGSSSYWSTNNIQDRGRIELPALGQEPFHAVVDLLSLEKVLPAMGKEVSLSVDSTSPFINVKITGQNGTAWNTRGFDANELPPVAGLHDGETIGAMFGQDLIAALKSSLLAVSNDSTRPVLQQIYVEFTEDGTAKFIACDGFRMSISGPHNMFTHTVGQGHTFYISTEIAKFMLKVIKPDQRIWFTLDPQHNVASASPGNEGDWSALWIQETGVYPNFRAVIPDSTERSRMCFMDTYPDNFLQAIGGMKDTVTFSFPFMGDAPVVLQYEKDGLKGEIPVNAELTGDWKEFHVDPRFFADALKAGERYTRIRIGQVRPDTVVLIDYVDYPLEWVVMPRHK